MQLQDVEIHYLTKKNFSSILESNPYVDKIHTIKSEIEVVIPDLKKEKFDLVIDLHHNLRSLQVKRKLKRPSVSFRKLNIEKFLAVRLKINRLPDLHIVDRYLETVENLGVVNDGKGLDFFIPTKDEININALPTSHQQGYIGFVIGAALATKQLPVEKIISICKKINRPIILLGGKEDEEKGKKIKDAVGDLILNACNKFNLNQSASLVKQAQTIITHDTGLMHIAAAFQKPIISVWGNTIPEFGMFVYKGTRGEGREIEDRKLGTGEKDLIVEVKNLSCRPCSKIGYRKCPRGHFKCMMEIDESVIISALKS